MASTDQGRYGLRSHYASYSWTPGVNTALHYTDAGPAICKWPTYSSGVDLGTPSANCTCGLYGVFEYTDIPTTSLVGVVEYWGRVRMGSRGIRAQYGRIIALAPGPKMAHHIGRLDFPERLFFRALGDRYEAETHRTQRSLMNAITLTSPREFGITSPREYG